MKYLLIFVSMIFITFLHIHCKLNDLHSEVEQISIPPSSIFNVINNNCVAPCVVNFENLSSNASSFIWDFGDGNTSQEAKPSHLYQEGGNYEVRLNAIGGGDLEAESKKSVNILSTGNIFIRHASAYYAGITVNIDGTDYLLEKNDREQIKIVEGAIATVWECCIENDCTWTCRWEEPIELEIGKKYMIVDEGPKRWDLAIDLE